MLTESQPHIQSETPKDLIQFCCSRRTVALVVTEETKGVCEARFRRTANGEVVLTVAKSEKSMPLEGAKRCTVSFQHEGRVRLFATEVLNFLKAPNSPSGADAQLTLKTPESVRVRDSRLGVRVPVNPAVGLRVRVLRENNEFEEVGPRNISVSGLLVDSLGSQIQSEDQVKIELEHAGERIRIDCVVRRVHPDESIALVFVPVTKGSAAPDAIRQIVEKLEKDWMRRTRSLSAHMA